MRITPKDYVKLWRGLPLGGALLEYTGTGRSPLWFWDIGEDALIVGTINGIPLYADPSPPPGGYVYIIDELM